jgi:hypothetical protein
VRLRIGELAGRVHRGLACWLEQPDVRIALIAVLSFRVACSALAIIPGLLGFAPHPIWTPLDYLTGPWDHFDTGWYTDIARHGYARLGSSAFMPLYPLAMWASAPFTGGSVVAAGLLVSTVAAFCALRALYRITEHLTPGRGLAPYAVLVALMLPTSFVLMAAYTESLFLALALWVILAALESKWSRVALLGALAALTRQQGVLVGIVALPPLWGWASQYLRVEPVWLHAADRQRTASSAPTAAPMSVTVPTPAMAAAVSPLFAYCGWLLILRNVLRAPLPWQVLTSSRGWNQHWTWPGASIVADIGALLHAGGRTDLAPGSLALDVIASLTAAVALAIAWRRLPSGLALYLVAIWVSAQMKELPSGLSASEARYMLSMLPLALVPAGWLARGGRPIRLAWVAGGALCQILFLWMFVLGVWVP